MTVKSEKSSRRINDIRQMEMTCMAMKKMKRRVT